MSPFSASRKRRFSASDTANGSPSISGTTSSTRGSTAARTMGSSRTTAREAAPAASIIRGRSSSLVKVATPHPRPWCSTRTQPPASTLSAATSRRRPRNPTRLERVRSNRTST